MTEVLLKELLLHPVRNGVYKPKDQHGSGVDIVNMGELFAYDRIVDQSMKSLELTDSEKARFLLVCGDLLFARRSVQLAGSGKVSIIGDIDRDLTFESSIIMARLNQTIAFPLYYFYLFSSSIGKAITQSITTGTNVSGIRGSALMEVTVPHPSLPNQKKIASVLSAYDDLIENNERRIKILEEMAQSIYREWFVNYRFPGHENVKMVDSKLGEIPEGWETKCLSDVAEVVDCLHSKKPDEEFDSELFAGMLLQVWNIGEAGKLDLSKKYQINESDYVRWTSRIELRGGDCVITNVGRIGAVARIPSGIKVALGRNMTGVRPRDIPPEFLNSYLQSSHFEDEVRLKQDSGTIMGSLNVRGIVRLNITIPPQDVFDSHRQIIIPITKELENIVAASQNLRQTRDLLLPKLISGELDVEELDIALA